MTNEKVKPNYKIVGINLIVMVLYTLLSRAIDKSDGVIFSAFLIVGQVIVCFVSCIASLFIAKYKNFAGMWLLSALAVLLIGFSTCMAVYTIKI